MAVPFTATGAAVAARHQLSLSGKWLKPLYLVDGVQHGADWRLYAGGRQQGQFETHCAGSGRRCQVSFILAHGSLQGRLVFDPARAGTTLREAGTITGGTGAYRGAKGTFSIAIPKAAPTSSKLTLKLEY